MSHTPAPPPPSCTPKVLRAISGTQTVAPPPPPSVTTPHYSAGLTRARLLLKERGRGWVGQRSKKVCVLQIGLIFSALLINFIFCPKSISREPSAPIPELHPFRRSPPPPNPGPALMRGIEVQAKPSSGFPAAESRPARCSPPHKRGPLCALPLSVWTGPPPPAPAPAPPPQGPPASTPPHRSLPLRVPPPPLPHPAPQTSPS